MDETIYCGDVWKWVLEHGFENFVSLLLQNSIHVQIIATRVVGMGRMLCKILFISTDWHLHKDLQTKAE